MKGDEIAYPIGNRRLEDKFFNISASVFFYHMCIGIKYCQSEAMVGAPDKKIEAVTMPETTDEKGENNADI